MDQNYRLSSIMTAQEYKIRLWISKVLIQLSNMLIRIIWPSLYSRKPPTQKFYVGVIWDTIEESKKLKNIYGRENRLETRRCTVWVSTVGLISQCYLSPLGSEVAVLLNFSHIFFLSALDCSFFFQKLKKNFMVPLKSQNSLKRVWKVFRLFF